ncbi:unnamed protein product [Cylindrotheca closterium]|uniref:Uncharacterized protein n=1 Tax=Cylindrotheca closterium TaxID=2856 RepID=A0AAD2FM35_9STRA|nr:unnamed protein product [Cylindrotheca closterium]
MHSILDFNRMIDTKLLKLLYRLSSVLRILKNLVTKSLHAMDCAMHHSPSSSLDSIAAAMLILKARSKHLRLSDYCVVQSADISSSTRT